jgi:hypothetical protein
MRTPGNANVVRKHSGFVHAVIFVNGTAVLRVRNGHIIHRSFSHLSERSFTGKFCYAGKSFGRSA